MGIRVWRRKNKRKKRKEKEKEKKRMDARKEGNNNKKIKNYN